MPIGLALKLYFTRALDFRGRSCRAEFWWPLILNLVLVLLFGLLGIEFEEGRTEESGIVPGLMFGFVGLYVIATLLPTTSLYIRRLHDMNQSGWIYLGIVVGSLFLAIVSFVALIVIGSIKGTTGTNRFGPDPLNPGVSVADLFD